MDLCNKREQELRCIWSVGKKWDPYMPTRTREALLHGWHKAVERSLGWVDSAGEGADEGLEGEEGMVGDGNLERRASDPTTAAAAAGVAGEAGGPVGGRQQRPKLKRFATMRMQRQDSDARKHTWAKAVRRRLAGVDWGVVSNATLLVLGGVGVGFMVGSRYMLARRQ